MSAEIVEFPSERKLCHWCGEYRHEVETMTLSQKGAQTFKRTTLRVCAICIDSWAYFAKQAEHPFHRPKLRGQK